MAHQDTASKDQPPAYPSNDKPPDYHDVFPRRTATPPPVDISPVPDNTPAAHIPSANITPRTIVHSPPPGSVGAIRVTRSNNGYTTTTTNHPISIDIAFDSIFNGMTMNNSSTTTATIGTPASTVMTQPSSNSSTAYPPENIVLTQPPTYNSHLYNATENQNHAKAVECYDVLWKILVVLSVIAAIIALPIGLHACIWACIGYHSDDKSTRRSAGIAAIIMCTLTYVGLATVVIVLPIVLM